jgi:hypothetical protein
MRIQYADRWFDAPYAEAKEVGIGGQPAVEVGANGTILRRGVITRLALTVAI